MPYYVVLPSALDWSRIVFQLSTGFIRRNMRQVIRTGATSIAKDPRPRTPDKVIRDETLCTLRDKRTFCILIIGQMLALLHRNRVLPHPSRL